MDLTSINEEDDDWLAAEALLCCDWPQRWRTRARCTLSEADRRRLPSTAIVIATVDNAESLSISVSMIPAVGGNGETAIRWVRTIGSIWLARDQGAAKVGEVIGLCSAGSAESRRQRRVFTGTSGILDRRMVRASKISVGTNRFCQSKSGTNGTSTYQACSNR